MVCPAALLLLTCLGFANGQVETITFAPYHDYFYSKYAHGPVDWIKIDGKEIAKAPEGTHCVPPNDCWEEIPKENYLIISGHMRTPTATLTVQPANKDTGAALSFLYKRDHAEYPDVPANSVPVYAQSLKPNENILQTIIFDEKPGAVSYNGPFSVHKRGYKTIDLLGMTGFQKDDHVFFTGHLGTKKREMVIAFKNGHKQYITVQPKEDPSQIRPIFTFIDNKRSFKLK